MCLATLVIVVQTLVVVLLRERIVQLSVVFRQFVTTLDSLVTITDKIHQVSTGQKAIRVQSGRLHKTVSFLTC